MQRLARATAPTAALLAAVCAGCGGGSQLAGAVPDAALLPPAEPEPQGVAVAGYELGRPKRSFALPDELREVSAVAAVGGRVVACVQDELGRVYELDLDSGRFGAVRDIAPPGDYEGLACVGGALWLLRSDGHLLAADGRTGSRQAFPLDAQPGEFEGLAFDAASGRLLVARKGPAPGVRALPLRPVYAVDPESGTTSPTPFLSLDPAEVLAEARRLGVALPTKRDKETGERVPTLELRPSEVAVHPVTGDLWVLSAADRAVLVVARDGRLLDVHVFDKTVLWKPEAAAFLPDGDLVLASEGRKGPALLHVFGPGGARAR